MENRGTDLAGLLIAVDDPRAADVGALLGRHLAFAREYTLPGEVFALDLEGLLDPAVSFFSLRVEGELLGVGALRQLDDSHVEIKSMHTAEAARGRGLGRKLLEHLLSVAVQRGFTRASLETGTQDAFAAARALYAGSGFVPCAPFGDYRASPNSVCMTLALPHGGASAPGP